MHVLYKVIIRHSAVHIEASVLLLGPFLGEESSWKFVSVLTHQVRDGARRTLGPWAPPSLAGHRQSLYVTAVLQSPMGLLHVLLSPVRFPRWQPPRQDVRAGARAMAQEAPEGGGP